MRYLLMSILALTLAAPVHAGKGSPGEGLKKSQPCQACHGKDGNGIGDPQYPIIAGQYEDYLVHSLKAYRSGARQNVIMQGFATTLSDQDIADLAAYFASQPSKLDDMSSRTK